MSKEKKLPNLYNLVDKLVMIRNTYKDYEPKSKKTIDFMMLEHDFNDTIREIQNFYDYIDYNKMIDDIKNNNFVDNNQRETKINWR